MSDSPNVYKDGQYVGFMTSEGLYVIQCGECRKENWAPAVAIGSCYWCGWDGRRWAESANEIWKHREPSPNEKWSGFLP